MTRSPCTDVPWPGTDRESLRQPVSRQTVTRSRKKNVMPALINPSPENLASTLFPIRLAAVTGLVAAVVLFVNAAKRAGLIEVSSATQLVAPLAQALAIIMVVGLAAIAMRRSSRFSSVALALNVLGLAAATGVEWVINLVFVGLDPAQIVALRAGPLGTAFVAASMTFLLGSLLYCVALLRDGMAPRTPTVAYAIATVP